MRAVAGCVLGPANAPPQLIHVGAIATRLERLTKQQCAACSTSAGAPHVALHSSRKSFPNNEAHPRLARNLVARASNVRTQHPMLGGTHARSTRKHGTQTGSRCTQLTTPVAIARCVYLHATLTHSPTRAPPRLPVTDVTKPAATRPRPAAQCTSPCSSRPAPAAASTNQVTGALHHTCPCSATRHSSVTAAVTPLLSTRRTAMARVRADAVCTKPLSPPPPGSAHTTVLACRGVY